MRNNMKKIFSIVLIATGLFIISCDERDPANADSSSSTTSGAYKITAVAQAYGFDNNGNAVAVGEDLKGPFVTTYIVHTTNTHLQLHPYTMNREKSRWPA